MAGQKPVWKTTAAGVSVALWKNDAVVGGRNVTMLKATVERRYKDAQGQWASSSSFGRNEVPLLLYCLGRAYGKMLEKPDNSESEGNDELVM